MWFVADLGAAKALFLLLAGDPSSDDRRCGIPTFFLWMGWSSEAA